MLFLRLVPLAALALTVVYISVFLYLRATYKDRLMSETVGIDAAIVDARVRTYVTRLRPRLAMIVYGIPVAVFTAIIFLDLI